MPIDVNRPLYVVGYAAALAVAFTAAVMTVQVAMAARIRRNEEYRDEKALVEVLRLSDTPETLSPAACAELVRRYVDRTQTVRDPQTGRVFRLFRAFRTLSHFELEAVAFDVAGNGFWAPIRGLVALEPDLRLRGVVFLEHSETPGLGGRITEAWFQEQFRGVDVSPPEAGGKRLYISRERPGPADPRRARTVDAITGATQTSLAVERLLNANLEAFLRAMAAAPSPSD